MLNIIEGALFVLYKAKLLKTTLRAYFFYKKLLRRRIEFRIHAATGRLPAVDLYASFFRVGIGLHLKHI
jgi:hypothetical protein